MEISVFHLFFAGTVFLCLGSAISAYAYRTPKYEEYLWRKEAHQFLNIAFTEKAPASFSQGRSYCPSCKHSLTIVDLVPLFSFLFNKARCRYCGEKIHWRYPATELLTLLVCMPLLWIADDILALILLSSVFCLLIAISLIDWRHQWIPDQLNLALLGVALLYSLYVPMDSLRDSIIAMLVGYLLIAGLRQIYLMIKGVEAIGLGDAKLLAALGAWQGMYGLFNILFLASVLGTIYALVSKKGTQQTIAFGPFLAIAAIVHFVLNSLFLDLFSLIHLSHFKL